jgi:hypothetical protein
MTKEQYWYKWFTEEFGTEREVEQRWNVRPIKEDKPIVVWKD